MQLQSIAKRTVLATYDALSALICATAVSLSLITPAYAYVDPSVMTYTIQAIAGVAVALGAVAGVAFRRGRKTIMNALHIDENAQKEHEGAVHRFDTNGQPILNEGEITPNDQPVEAKHEPKNLSWPARFWRSSLASVLVVGTLLLVAPAEMVASNAESLAFTLSDVWAPLLGIACIIALCLAVLLSLLRGKAFDIAFAIVVTIGLCFYLQAMAFNQTLPSADGTKLYLEEHAAITVISTITIVTLLVGALALAVKKRLFSRGVGVFVSLTLIIVQGVALVSIAVDESASSTGDRPAITKEGLFELSPSDNVVVFVLDTYDIVDLDGLLETDPDILDEMTGFTYFSNSTGFCTPTRYGVPYLLTGVWPRADETWNEFLNRRYPDSTLTDDIVNAGYSLYVYTDTPGRGGMEHLVDLAQNIHPIDKAKTLADSSFNMGGAMRMMYCMALYRDMPWLLKGPFWFYTDQVNQAAYDVDAFGEVDSGERFGSDTPYIIDDAAFYKQLVNRRLSVFDDGSEKGALHFIHLAGLHTPHNLDANAHFIGDQETTPEARYEQAKGELLIVDEYLRQMKNLGLYDDATIIITADHGMWPWEYTIEKSESDEDMAGGPIIVVKPAGTAEQNAQPCKVSEVRTGFLDYPATIIEAVGGDKGKYGTTVFEVDDPTRMRTYIWPTHDGTTDFIFYEYAIDGEASNWNDWKRTGVEWEFNQPATTAL